MNNPHKSQAAAMARAGELPDGEQLRECINSGQVSAAQVVAHAEAGEIMVTPYISQAQFDRTFPVTHQEAGELPIQAETYSEFRNRFVNVIGSLPNQRESWEAGYISGGFDEKQKTARIERNRDMWKDQCARQAAALAAIAAGRKA